MSVFGNIPAFNGFGKPSIKLEFDDNEALLDFQKKMQAADDSAELPEVDFDELKGTAKGGEELTKTEFKNFFNNPEPFREVKDITKDFKDYIYVNYPNTLRKAYKVETPLKGKEKFVYVFADFEHLKFENSTKQDREDIFGLIKPTLENPDLVFVADGENNFVKSFNSKNGNHIILNFIPTSKNGFLKTDFIKDFDKLYKKYKKNGSMLKYTHTARNFNGLGAANIHDFYFVEVRFPCAYKDDLIYSDNQIFNKENLGAAGDVYLITDTREKARKDLDEIKAFKKFFIDKPIGVKFINQVGDFDFKTPLTSDGTYSFIELKDRYDERWQDLFREYLYTKYGNLVGRKEIKPLLQKDKYYQQLLTEYKKDKEFINSLSGGGLGKTANNAIYNNVSILDWRGFVPTYRILDDYSDFFKIADSKSTFAGFGLGDTKKLIADTCRQHWRDCMAIAKHLKGDSLLQSCFNLWHWLHYNIRYEYDHDGREEIRTPLRVWQDRARGVDCDCLSVFSWCVLKCMGYNPAFELVAFKGRPQFSHIFVNCDGVVVDRVWFIFNNRPPLITKSEIYRIDLTNDLAGLF